MIASRSTTLFQQTNGAAQGGGATAAAPAPAAPAPAPTAANMHISAAGVQAIMGHEREVLSYYNDPAGNCTWGTGFLAHFGACTAAETATPVTHDMVTEEYRRRLATTETAVRRQLGNTEVSQEQYDALVSYTYNMGPTGAATALTAVREGRPADAAATMLAHASATRRGADGQPVLDANGRPIRDRLPGLVARRNREAAPFLAAPNEGGQNAANANQTTGARGANH